MTPARPWTLMNDNRSIRQRAFYYTHVFADHQNADVVYAQNTSLFRSADQGKTLTSDRQRHARRLPRPVDRPRGPGAHRGGQRRRRRGDDQHRGQLDRGAQDFPTAQFYHVITTKHIPFHVCGSQQDNSTACTPFNWNMGGFGFGGAPGGGGRRAAGPGYNDPTSGGMVVSYVAGGGEPGYIGADPNDPDLFYSGTNNGGYLDKFNRRTGLSREVNPYPWFYSGEPSRDIKERWQWTFPIIFSKADPKRLYVSSQRLWMTMDGGATWAQLSGDLTRHAPETQGPSGGPITGDMNGPEVYGVIFSVAPGKRNVERHLGRLRRRPRARDARQREDVDQRHAAGHARLRAREPDRRLGVRRRHRLRLGAQAAARRLLAVHLAHARLRPHLDEDRQRHPRRRLRARGPRGPHAPRPALRRGQHGVYISYDDGDHWQSLRLNMPDVPVSDLIVEANELVISSHGRGFWVLDNIAPLRQVTRARRGGASLHAADAIRSGLAASITWSFASGAAARLARGARLGRRGAAPLGG
jgi:hypothetical protein